MILGGKGGGDKMKLPYIGVTGFMSANEVEEVLRVVPAGAKRMLMVGVLVSSKTMQGVPNKWPNRYPGADEIAGIFPDHPLALNLVHFNTKELDKLLVQMLEVTKLGGKNFHGFQLNIKWPNPETLYEYKKQFPDKVIVLQCGGGALESVDFSPTKLALRAIDYTHVCDYLLVDPSGGLGKSLDPNKGLEYLNHLNVKVEEMGFGIAGGLSSDTIEGLISPIVRNFPNTSIDAEGRLRDENDHLDVKKAQEFVSKAYELFGNYEK